MFLVPTFPSSAFKKNERETRIKILPSEFHQRITGRDNSILSLPAASIISDVQSGALDPEHVLLAFGKKALQAHAETNCLTEVMISRAQVWAKQCNRSGPLAGMPISLKDSVGVTGFDATVGYSAWANKPLEKDSALIRLLHDAGAVPFVKVLHDLAIRQRIYIE